MEEGRESGSRDKNESTKRVIIIKLKNKYDKVSAAKEYMGEIERDNIRKIKKDR